MTKHRKRLAMLTIFLSDMELDKASYLKGYYDGSYESVRKIYDWLIDEKRIPAKEHFSAGHSRDVAIEIERLMNHL
jgi:effector-binding domain-containing protein